MLNDLIQDGCGRVHMQVRTSLERSVTIRAILTVIDKEDGLPYKLL